MTNVSNGESTVAYDEIERIPAPAPEVFIARYLRRRRPVVMLGAHEYHQRMREWNLPLLRERLGDRHVIVGKTDDRRLRVSPTEGSLFGKVPLGSIIEAIESERDPGWVVVHPVEEFADSFADQLRAPAYCAGARYLRSKVWLAPAGTFTPMHWDLPHNLVAPLFGSRRILLYPRRQSLLLYPNPPYSKTPNYARFNPEQPDFDRFPLARHARACGTIMRPGDLLFIPSGWWHQVRTLETSFNVNFWWGGSALAMAQRVSNAFKRWRGIYQGEWN